MLIVTAAAAEQRSRGVPKSTALPGPAAWARVWLRVRGPKLYPNHSPPQTPCPHPATSLLLKYYLLGKAEDDLLQSKRERTGERVPNRLVRVRVRARLGVGDGLGRARVGWG